NLYRSFFLSIRNSVQLGIVSHEGIEIGVVDVVPRYRIEIRESTPVFEFRAAGPKCRDFRLEVRCQNFDLMGTLKVFMCVPFRSLDDAVECGDETLRFHFVPERLGDVFAPRPPCVTHLVAVEPQAGDPEFVSRYVPLESLSPRIVEPCPERFESILHFDDLFIAPGLSMNEIGPLPERLRGAVGVGTGEFPPVRARSVARVTVPGSRQARVVGRMPAAAVHQPVGGALMRTELVRSIGRPGAGVGRREGPDVTVSVGLLVPRGELHRSIRLQPDAGGLRFRGRLRAPHRPGRRQGPAAEVMRTWKAFRPGAARVRGPRFRTCLAHVVGTTSGCGPGSAAVRRTTAFRHSLRAVMRCRAGRMRERAADAGPTVGQGTT